MFRTSVQCSDPASRQYRQNDAEQTTCISASPSPRQGREQRLGTGFLLLALFSAILGGIIALPAFPPFGDPVSASSGLLVSHAVLLSFFVVCPAAMGAMAQWLLPSALQTTYMALSGFSRAAWLLLALGVVVLPLCPQLGLGFWALGMIALSLALICTIFEERRVGFRDFSPFVWSLLWGASVVLFVAPVIMALLLYSLFQGQAVSALLSRLVVPELSLVLLPALGLVSLQQKQGFFWRAAPWLLGVMALVPVLWVGEIFGHIPAYLMDFIIFFGLVVPGLCFLLLFCGTVWRSAEFENIGLAWRVMALVFLFCGFLQLLGRFFHINTVRAGFHGDSGRQMLIFGCLFSLAAGFYTWLEDRSKTSGRILRYYSNIHVAITALGLLCSLSPDLALYATILMGASIIFFIIAGLWAVLSFFSPLQPAKTIKEIQG